MNSQGANYPLQLEQGCDFLSPVFTWIDDTTGLPVNLVGYTALMKIRTSQFGSGSNPGTVLLTLTDTSGVLLGGSTGQVLISITHVQDALNFGTFWYDLILTTPSGQKAKMLSGTFIFGPTDSI